MLTSLKNKFVKPSAIFLIERYFAFRNWQPMWRYLNREGRRLLRLNPPSLNEVQKRIIGDLKKNGIAASHVDELFPGENLLPLLQKYTADLIAAPEKQVNVKKSVFLRYLLEKIPEVSFANPFMRAILNKKILDIVNAYLGVWSKFYYLTLNVTRTMTKFDPPVMSQNWHRDPEDKKMCKIFIYLNDVHENSGPFVYIPGSQFGGRYGKLFPQKPPKGFYPLPGAVEESVQKGDIKICTGKAGTVVFADTAGLHRGGYAAEKERVMFTAGFLSNASARKNLFSYGVADDVKLIPETRFALKRSIPKFSMRALYLYKSITRDRKSDEH